jgi:RHS repeat-associated protein
MGVYHPHTRGISMKKYNKPVSKLILVLFIVTNLFTCMPTLSFAAKEDTKPRVNYTARAKSEIIVKFKDNKKSDNVRSLVKGKLKLSKFDRKNRFERQKIDVLEIGENDDTDKVIAELKKNPDVEYAQPNYKLEPTVFTAPAGSRFIEQWGLYNNGQNVEGQNGRPGVDVNGITAWNLSSGSSDVLVGVLDTGIDISHKDLVNSIYVNTAEKNGTRGVDDDGNGYVDDINGWDFANDDDTVFDSSPADRHGTYTAGIIAANTTGTGIVGVAPNVKIVPLKFINSEAGYTCDAIKAIEYAMNMGIKIINCSFGGTDNNYALKDTMANSGILFVCAAGNRGGNVSELPFYPSCFNIPNVLSVASVDGNGILAPFSSYGDIIQVAAPGTNILSTTPENTYDYFSGTSASAPFVTGVAALVKSYIPASTITSIADRIKTNVVSCSALQGKLTTGGRVDANAALTNTKPAGDTYNGPGQVVDTIQAGNQGGDIDTWYTQDQLAKIKERLHYGENGVNPASGNYSLSVNDMSIPAPGFQVNINRTYNSRDEKVLPLGRGWTFGFEGNIRGVEVSGNGVKEVMLPSGAVERFRVEGSTYVAEDSRSMLIKESDNSYVLTTKDQYTYGFNTNGWLAWMKDRNGNQVSITVDANGKISEITDTVGRKYNIHYNGQNLIDVITDPLGRTINYNYNGNQLKEVIDPSGSKMYYNYDTYGFLESIKDHDNKQIVFLSYNHAVGENQHKVAEATDPSGHKSNYAYDVPNKKTTVTDSNARNWTYWFDNEMYTKQTQDPEGKSTYTEYKLYGGKNKFGEVLSTTDRNGNKTQYELDDKGNVTKIINPDESCKTFEYDDKNNVKSQTDELRKRTDFVYDTDKINLIRKANALDGTSAYVDGTSSPEAFAVTTYAYYTQTEANAQFACNVSGLLKRVTDPENHTLTYRYDKYGNVIEETDKYDQSGNLVTEPNLKYVTTVTSYNAISWKMYSISPGGHRTDYTYDPNGQLEKAVLDNDETSRIVYDRVGRKIQEISPNQYSAASDDLPNHGYNAPVGNRYTYYDTEKVKTATDPLNYTTTYYYDIYENLIKVVNPTGSAICYDYDNMDRVIKEYYKETETSPEVLLKEYSYSILADKRTQKTEKKYLNDTEVAETVQVYDYANRLVEQQNPDLTRAKTEYDLNGTVKSTTAANGSITKYVYDGLNRQTEQWIPLEVSNGNTYYAYSKTEYDKAGKTLKEIKAIDKVLLDTLPAKLYSVNYAYYKNGLKKTVTDSEDRKTEYFYDDDLNVNKEVISSSASEVLTTEYVYNHLNKVEDKKVHARAGDIYGNDYTNTQDAMLTTHYTYDKNGNVKTIKDPNNIVTTNDYDDLNRLIKTSQPGVSETGSSAEIALSTKYDWEGKTIEQSDALGRKTFYEYDKRGFLTGTVDAMGGVAIFDYDRAGRKIAEVSPVNFIKDKAISQLNRTEYVYDLMNRLKAKKEVFTDNKGVMHDYYSKAYRYDNSGNAVKELDAGGIEAGTGTTLDEKINSGYGTEYVYNYANLVSTMLDPVSKERALPFTLKYEYDGMGRKIAGTNANGAVTYNGYDGTGNMLYAKIAKSSASSPQAIQINTYDKAGRQLTQTDGNGNTTVSEYTSFGRTRSVTYPGDDTVPANTVTFQYDMKGNLKTQKDSTGKVSLFTYDNQNRMITQTEMKSDNTEVITQQAIKYDLNGNKRFVTDGRGKTTENTYDDLNRLKTSSISVNGVSHTNTYDYDRNGNQTSASDWLGNTSISEYDPLSRLIQKKDANDIVIQELEYNNNNAQIKSYDALRAVTSYEYDRNNRLLATIDPENHRTSQYYDNTGNIISKTDARNNTLSYTYDEFNRLTEATNSRSEKTGYAYDLNGNMLSQKDGAGKVTSYEYNAANKLIRKINDGGKVGAAGNYTYLNEKVESYTYYTDGSLKSKTDRNGRTTDYTYDIHGRLLTQTIGVKSISYTYDENGNQLTMTDSTGVTVRTYDELDRVLAKTVPNFGTTNFSYDIVTGVQPGFVKETTSDFKGNITEKVMDKVGRLKYVTTSGQPTEYGYYDDGSRHFVLYPNGAREEYTYDADKLVKMLVNTSTSGAAIDSYSYTYDSAHNQTSKTDAKGTTFYTYDSLNRLDSVTEPDGKNTSYIYDKAGNRQSESITINGSTTVTVYAYDEQNRLKSTQEQSNGLSKITSYEYDPNGNMVSKAQSTIKPSVTGSLAGFNMAKAGSYANTDASFYEYDEWNQLVKTVDSYNTATYNYNGDGLRVGKSKTELATLLSDDFSGGLEKWASTSNATISNNQLKVVNNELLRSASGNTATWKDFILEVDVKISDTSAGLVFRSADNNNYYVWQLTTASGGKLRPQKYVNGTAAVIKEVTCPLVSNVWYHVKIQASDSTITTYIDGKLIDTTTDSTFAGGKTGFRQSGTDTAVFDNYLLVNTGVSTKTTTRYLYESDKVILETDASGNQTGRNVYGTNLLSRTADAETLYYMYNGHADVTALIRVDGTIAASYYYDAFGNILQQTGIVSNSVTYAGYQYDAETGLYYLNSRYYDSKIARFLSEDTYDGDPNDPLSLNLYTYCHNEPIMYTDPTGHVEACDIHLSTEDQAKILKYTEYYYAATTEKAKDYWHQQAVAMRTAAGSGISGYEDNYNYNASHASATSDDWDRMVSTAVSTPSYASDTNIGGVNAVIRKNTSVVTTTGHETYGSSYTTTSYSYNKAINSGLSNIKNPLSNSLYNSIYKELNNSLYNSCVAAGKTYNDAIKEAFFQSKVFNGYLGLVIGNTQANMMMSMELQDLGNDLVTWWLSPTENPYDMIKSISENEEGIYSVYGNKGKLNTKIPSSLEDSSPEEKEYWDSLDNVVKIDLQLSLKNGIPNNPGVVRRFMSKTEYKEFIKNGFKYDSDDSRGGISSTSTKVAPVNPDSIKRSTGALGADYYVDINVKDKNVILKGITKGGVADWKIQDDVNIGDIVGSGRVRK